jgi:hypothetical protein
MSEPTAGSTNAAVRLLPWLLVSYAAASLWHFVHNGAYLHHYPNLPATWSPTEVYVAGCLLAILGLCGYLLYRAGRVAGGLALLMLYAAAGFGGLLHYTRAPLSHHTTIMNLTIWIETATGALLLLDLIAVAMYKLKPGRGAAAKPLTL